MGWGFPPPHKNECYNLVAQKGLGSTREFLGLPHRDAQGDLVLLVGSPAVRLQPHTAWSQRESHPFLCCKYPPPPKFWVSECGSPFKGSIWQALLNVLVTKAAPHHQFLTPVRLLAGPLMAMDEECHLPTHAEHDW